VAIGTGPIQTVLRVKRPAVTLTTRFPNSAEAEGQGS
jgi:hypothetical protein